MTATTKRSPLGTLLRKHSACDDAVKWAEPFATLQEAWDVCPRADWMLWLLVQLHGYKGAVVHAAVDCAETALPIFEERYPNDPRVRDCLAVTRRWADGKATIDELRKARTAAATGAVAYAAAAAAAAAAADAAYAADAAAAYAAAAAAADADAFGKARIAALARMADLVRSRIPNPEVI